MERFASIDVGSNTLRLLIAEPPLAEPLQPIRVERRITRLGEFFLPSKTLQLAAIERSIAALNEFHDLMNLWDVSEYLAGATAVVREASNGRHFLEMVKSQTGLKLLVLSGAEEARLSLLGVVSAVPNPEAPMAVFDIGGGSTELILTSSRQSKPEESLSLPLGVVNLTEVYLQENPPGLEACNRLRQQASNVLHQHSFPENLHDRLWVGTAGTVTTLASMRLGLPEYDATRVSGTILDRTWLAELCKRLAEMTIAERSSLPGLEPGREDIILAGALLILELMERFCFSQFTVSDAGLLEGLFLDLCRKLSV